MKQKLSQQGGEMEDKIAPKSSESPPGGVSEATFYENGRPSQNTAIIVRIAHPAPPERSIFAPLGSTVGQKPFRRGAEKTSQKNTPTSHHKLQK